MCEMVVTTTTRSGRAEICMHFSISARGHLKIFPLDTQIVVATCYCIGQKVDNLATYIIQLQ